MSVYGLDPGRSDPEGDAETDACQRFERMSINEMAQLARDALDDEDMASAAWPLRHKLCAYLARQILEGEA